VLDIRWKAGLFFFALCAICAFLWLIISAKTALIAFSIGLLIYIISHIAWLHQLHIWFKNPLLAQIPEGAGIWEDVFTALLQYARNNISNQQQLSSALERFTLTANAIPDGLIILGASNEIEWCTPHAEHQLGISLATDKNLPIVNLVRDSHFIAYLYNNDFSEPFKLKSWQNPELVYEIQLINFGENQKLLICRDTTQLEKVEVMRRDFIANVSHELRTPLTVVGGFLETLGDMQGAVPDAIKTYFTMMQEQTNRMRRIIEDLLTLSKIESNIEEPENTEIDMGKLLTQIKNDALNLSKTLYKTPHNISLTFDETLHISGAQNELQSALSNLVGNAVRYTPKNGAIFIDWYRQDEHAIFSVRDTGIGIAPEHIERLTERFYRVDRGRSRETGGTGLGLSIVKHILIRHQAKLEISSEIGVGSSFNIIFPKTRMSSK
jgi:two-component system, OmpR family, phosphate regulon sensor histidine kinase PhoR